MLFFMLQATAEWPSRLVAIVDWKRHCDQQTSEKKYVAEENSVEREEKGKQEIVCKEGFSLGQNISFIGRESVRVVLAETKSQMDWIRKPAASSRPRTERRTYASNVYAHPPSVKAIGHKLAVCTCLSCISQLDVCGRLEKAIHLLAAGHKKVGHRRSTNVIAHTTSGIALKLCFRVAEGAGRCYL